MPRGSATSALYLGFDVGTQSTKGVLFDAASGGIVARGAKRYGLLEGLPPGAAEQHPDTWIDAVQDVARQMAASGALDGARVRGVGVSGQQHGLVVLGEDDRVVRPAKLWCDTATVREAREITAAVGYEVPTGFTSPKILWLRRSEPANWARVRSVLLPHDFVNFRLTGKKTMEAGDASGTGLFDPKARTWDARAIDFVDPRLPDMLPPLVDSAARAGELSEGGAKLLGLPAGCLVSTGGGDNMMSAIGSGATTPGVTIVSLGTSGTVFCHSASPIVDPEGLVHPFCDSTGGWLPLLCTMNVTGVTEELSAAFGANHGALTAAAEKRIAPGSDGLLWLPYLQGERVPNLPEATGALLGMRHGWIDRGRLYRAAIEGTTLALVSGVERMKRLGIRVDSVRVVGGGAKNPLWRQILADALQAPVARPLEADSAALGAALQALWVARREDGERVTAHEVASEHVRVDDRATAPRAENAGVYRELRERLEGMTKALLGQGVTP